MTLAVICKCGGEAVFHIDGETEKRPTAQCDGCGQSYRIKVEKIDEAEL